MKWDRFKHTTADHYIHNYPEILDLKVNAPSGVYDVVGLTNWRSSSTMRTLGFADKLGLTSGSPYIAFDYWGQKLMGVFKDLMKVQIEPHDTRVFLIHPLLDRPQLLGTSRHITRAYSIKNLAWDGSHNPLHGASDTVPGDDHALYFCVPAGFTVARVGAAIPGKSEIPVRHDKSGNSLKVVFAGHPEAVDWEVQFAGKVRK